jgi:hypothetical protein
METSKQLGLFLAKDLVIITGEKKKFPEGRPRRACIVR